MTPKISNEFLSDLRQPWCGLSDLADHIERLQADNAKLAAQLDELRRAALDGPVSRALVLEVVGE